MTPSVCRAARAMLNWTRIELSRASGVSRATISRFEQEPEDGDILLSNVRKLEEAFTKAGIEFLPGEGLRLKRGGWQE